MFAKSLSASREISKVTLSTAFSTKKTFETGHYQALSRLRFKLLSKKSSQTSSSRLLKHREDFVTIAWLAVIRKIHRTSFCLPVFICTGRKQEEWNISVTCFLGTSWVSSAPWDRHGPLASRTRHGYECYQFYRRKFRYNLNFLKNRSPEDFSTYP